jgi:hypothetical protein
MRDRKTAWFCLRESLHDFRLREWAPFGGLLGLQLLFLVLSANLHTSFGMLIAGGFAERVAGERILHYPAFYLALPDLTGLAEWVLALVPGCVLVPLALLLIAEPVEPAARAERGARLRRAVLPALTAAALNVLALLGWQWVGAKLVSPALGGAGADWQGRLMAWGVMVLGSYAISAVFLYIPVRAVQRGAGFAGAVGSGLAEGFQLLPRTTFVILLAGLLGIPFLVTLQMHAATIVSRMRPELVLLLLALYAVASSVTNYLVYASAMRLHWAVRRS